MRLVHCSFLVLVTLFAPRYALASTQVLIADPVFDDVHFSDWVSQGERTDIPWKLDVSQHGLTYFERILARTDVTLTGDTLMHHAASSGQMLFFVQFTDANGDVYQSHNHIDLEDIKSADSNATFTQNVLVTPGDYRLDFAVYDTETHERSVGQRSLHVAPLHSDPMPQIWDGAQSLEIVPDLGSPDKYFLPRATDSLHLPIATRGPVAIQIIASGNWTNELPALKVLSEMKLEQGSASVAMLSYERRSVFYEQDLAQPLDWKNLRPALISVDPNTINADGLAGRTNNLDFFLEEISRRVCASPDPPGAEGKARRVVIILSQAWDFHDGEKARSIHLTNSCARDVFYLRFDNPKMEARRSALDSAAPLDPLSTGDLRIPASSSGEPDGGMGTPHHTTDFLEHTLDALHPHVFDISSPEDFRKALATMLHDISNLPKTKGSE
jgi:hypothetical protein